MKIPTKLKIGNFVYNVKTVDNTSIEKCGKSAMRKQEIRLNDEMSQELKEETFLHEIVHQILDQKSFGDESNNEKLVDTISSGIYQVLKDNKLLK